MYVYVKMQRKYHSSVNKGRWVASLVTGKAVQPIPPLTVKVKAGVVTVVLDSE